KEFEAFGGRPERHRVAVGDRDGRAAVEEVGMEGRAAEVLQDFFAVDGQVDDGGVTVVEVGARELTVISDEQLFFASALIGVHAGDRSEVNVRIDEAGNEVLAFAGDYGGAGGRLGRIGLLNAEDAAVLDDDCASDRVVGILRGKNGYVGDPG